MDLQTAESVTDQPETISPSGKRLSRRQIALILQLDATDLSQRQIAAHVGFSEATISHVLGEWSDTRDLARKRLEAGAERLAQTVVKTKDSAVALKALGKLDVVREDAQAGNVQVAVMIGQPGQSLAPPGAVLTECRPADIVTLSPRVQSELTLSPLETMTVTEANSEAKATPLWGVSPDDVV